MEIESGPLLPVLLVAATVAVVSLARRLTLPAPLVLVVVGVVASFLPFLPPVELEPELVLTVILPPLLYVAAVRTSLVDFKAELWGITLLSVGLVLVTALVVGVVVMAVIPGVPPGAAFALGAVVAPPDAVAATAIARRVGLPRRIVTVLQGESLVNDATALVALRSAIAVLLAGTVSWPAVAGDFALAVVGGLGIGVATGFLMSEAVSRSADATTATCLSLLAPFVAFLPAEAVGASGVLAVVVAGLVIGHRSPVRASAATRVSTRTIWRTIQFLLENAVFLLIGLQARGVLEGAAESDATPGQVVGLCLGVLAAVVLVRPVWVFGTGLLTFATPLRRISAPTGWRELALVSWAGLRGVVTLAAVFALPADTPYREVLVLAALVVAAATLLGQGGTLPLVVRLLRLPGPDLGQDALEQAQVLQHAHEAGLRRLDVVLADEAGRGGPVADEVVARLRERSQSRPDSVWERLLPRTGSDEPPTLAYERLRLEMLRAEREELLRLRSAGGTSDDSLRRAQGSIDVEESLLDQLAARTAEHDARGAPEGVLVPSQVGRCEHLRDAPAGVAESDTPEGCEGCLAEGLTVWTALRRCLSCGYVGCCDSSPRRHADGHYGEAGHPVMRSAQPGEAWRWCYRDRLTG